MNAPKFNDVISWLFTKNPIPESFLVHKTKLNSIVPYLPEQFWNNPELTRLMNTFYNDLHAIPDSIQQLKSIQKLIIHRGIQKTDLWKFVPRRMPDQIQKIKDIEQLDENDARAKILMLHKTGNQLPVFLGGKPDTKNEANLEIVRNALSKEKELKRIQEEKDRENSNMYLKILNQDIISEMELTLFNVKILKKQNKVLMTFIDKFNKKKYFLENYNASFYISKSNSVIDNDYIVDPDPDKFIKYNITDWQLLNKLRFALNHAYKRSLNIKAYDEG